MSRPCRRCTNNCTVVNPLDRESPNTADCPLPDSNSNQSNKANASPSTSTSSSKKRKGSDTKNAAKRHQTTAVPINPVDLVDELTITCYICGETVTGSELFVNQHVDECVERKEMTCELQEYEWAGQSKFRTTFEEAKMFAGSTLVQVTYDHEDRDIDVEDNEYAVYGQPQYSEKSLNSVNKVSSSSASHSPPSPQPSTSTADDPPSSSTSTTSDLTIASLKERIRQLEKSEGAKCSVCLDILKEPVVSVICWHVYCEVCWLKSLKMKKLCPRCTAITTPGDLRRIYL